MRRLLQLIIFLSYLGMTVDEVWAQLDFEDHAFPEFVTSARALAMGNAYINKVDDPWAAFYNPAGLGTIRAPQFHLGNFHFEMSSDLMSSMGSGPFYEAPMNYLQSFDPDRMRDILSENEGRLAHARFNFFPNFTVRGMTIGYMFSQRNRAIFNEDTSFEVAERRDHGPVFALNASLFGGVFKVGASAVYLLRRDLYKSFAVSDPIVIDDDDFKFGKGLQITLGTRLTAPVAMLPSFSLVLRNATDNDFEGANESAGPPEKIPQTVDLGFSITPQISQQTRFHIEINLKDFGNAYETSASKRLAAGVELDFNRRIFIRAGSGDGWGSAGLGVRSRTFIFDLTTYAVDRSRGSEIREKEDRRWALSVSSGI